MQRELADAAATEQLGAAIAAVARPAIIYLVGDLGAGKTTLARGLIQALGYQDKIKSPTYTLVEPYDCDPLAVFHLDLYRLGEAEELEWLGLRDMLASPALLLVEWPERAAGVLPPADLTLRLDYAGDARRVTMQAASEVGNQLLQALKMT